MDRVETDKVKHKNNTKLAKKNSLEKQNVIIQIPIGFEDKMDL